MKTLKLTVAAVALTATSAVAGDVVTEGDTAMQNGEMPAELIRSRDITGGTVYTMDYVADDAWFAETEYSSIDTEWSEIGEIEDVVLSKDGQVKGIVAEVGGFLDIGDKHVMISFNDVKLVPVDDQSYAFVTRMSEEQLEKLPSVDEGFWN